MFVYINLHYPPLPLLPPNALKKAAADEGDTYRLSFYLKIDQLKLAFWPSGMKHSTILLSEFFQF